MNACVETVPSQVCVEVEITAQQESAPAHAVSSGSIVDFHCAPVSQPAPAKRSWFRPRWLGARRSPRAEGFPAAMPVGALPGVGPVYSRTLVQRGVITIGQLRRIPKPVLVAAFGKTIGKHIWECARS
jgi:DNA polymerase-4